MLAENRRPRARAQPSTACQPHTVAIPAASVHGMLRVKNATTPATIAAGTRGLPASASPAGVVSTIGSTSAVSIATAT